MIPPVKGLIFSSILRAGPTTGVSYISLSSILRVLSYCKDCACALFTAACALSLAICAPSTSIVFLDIAVSAMVFCSAAEFTFCCDICVLTASRRLSVFACACLTVSAFNAVSFFILCYVLS